MYNAELKRHTQRCVLITTEHQHKDELKLLRQEYEEKIAHMVALNNVEIAKLQTENHLLRVELTKAQGTAQALAVHAINRPTTNTTTNNNQMLKITNYLADHDAYMAQTNPHRVKNMLDQHLESYFFDGQQGLARFVVDHIIRMDDGKLILCCTDTTRKRFRFVNTEGKLAEDMKAKLLTTKLSLPIREMCNHVFDRIIKRLKSEKKVMISSGAGAFDIDILDKKVEYAEKNFIEIRSFDGEDNTDFLNELAILLRNAAEEDVDSDVHSDKQNGLLLWISW